MYNNLFIETTSNFTGTFWFQFLERFLKSVPRFLKSVQVELGEASRYSLNRNGNNTYCDKSIVVNNNWYRFTRWAGIMMASHCFPRGSCGTDSVGWISGPHPASPFEVTWPSECWHRSSSCRGASYTTSIRNCIGFYVYRFQKPRECNLMHCGVNSKTSLEFRENVLVKWKRHEEVFWIV